MSEADVDKITSDLRIRDLIIDECDLIKNMLLEKNRKYGNSACDPVRVFSKASPLERVNVRMDDKIARIINRQDDEDEDVELDLIGYLILKRVIIRKRTRGIATPFGLENA